MHYDYLLSFDKTKLKSSMSYVMKISLMNHLSHIGKTYTFDWDESYDRVLVCSAEEFFAIYPAMQKKNIPIDLFACSDTDDFRARGKTEKKVFLSDDALKFYPKADRLIVYFPSQIEFLKEHGIQKDCVVADLHSSFDETQPVTDLEKSAFRHFYRIPEEKDVVVSYGSYYDQPTVHSLESLVRNNPEKEFIFFGKGDRDSFNKRTLERTIYINNIRYVESIPEELYHSMLRSVNGLIVIGSYIPYPQILLDFMHNKVPVVSYDSAAFYPEILNNDTAIVPPDLASALKELYQLNQYSKAEEAYQWLIHNQDKKRN